jgi:hypothetical protein
MRLETHRVSEYVVRMLGRAEPVQAVTVDGGDIVQFDLTSGETVRLYLVENTIELYAIQGIVEANSAEGVYTLLLLWSDMLLPGHGQRVQLQDWMAALLALYGDRIFAYDINGPDIYLYPVYFDGTGVERVARYARTVDPATLGCARVASASAYFRASARIAGFQAARAEPPAPFARPGGALAQDYAALGLEPGAALPAVKRAYRRLALQFHPDLNRDPGAHGRMQRINAAYRRLVDALGD